MELISYIITYIVVISSILTLCILFHKKLAYFFNDLISDCRWFIQENDSLFTILFLILFFVEQLFLIIFAYLFRENVIVLQIIIGVFALVVVTTASFQKTILDVRIKHFKGQKEIAENLYLYVDELMSRFSKKKLLKKKLNNSGKKSAKIKYLNIAIVLIIVFVTATILSQNKLENFSTIMNAFFFNYSCCEFVVTIKAFAVRNTAPKGMALCTVP